MKWFLYVSIIAGLLASGCSNVSVQGWNAQNWNVPDQTVPEDKGPKPPLEAQVVYSNELYNFTFSLPIRWQGYSVLTQQWNGQADSPDTEKAAETEHGPVIVLRNPQWKADDPWQDIPIMVLTHKQWRTARKGRFSLNTDGFEYEIEHNSEYVFVIWNLFNWNEAIPGAREAEGIVRRNQAANAPHLYPDHTH
jgi:hypothetical protein